MRRSLAGLVLGISLLVASLTWAGFGLLRTVLDPDRSARVAESLLDDTAVRAQLSENLGAAVGASIPAEVPVTDAQLTSAADAALDSDVVRDIVETAFVQTHAALLGEADLPETIDLGAAVDDVSRNLAQQNPQLSFVIPPSPDLVVELPTEQIPDLGWLRRGLRRVVPLGALAAVAGVLLALLTTTHRPSVLRRAASWCVGAAVFWLVVALGIPWLAGRFLTGQSTVAGALVDAFFGEMTTPATVLAAAGAGLFVLSLLWPRLGWTDSPSPPSPLRRDPSPLHQPTDSAAVYAPPAPVVSAPAAAAPVPPASPAAAPHVPPAAATVPPATPGWEPQRPPRWIEGVGYVDDDPRVDQSPVPEPPTD